MIGTSGCQLSPPLGVEPPPENSRWSRSLQNRLPALLDRTSRTSTALARYELHSSRREGHKGRPNSSANQVRICGISDWIELQVADAPRAEHPGRLMTKPVSNRICRIYHVLLMIDSEDLSPIELQFHERLVPEGQPKTVNSLIFPDKLRSIYPEGRFLGGLARDFHDGEVDRINPYFALE